LLQNFWFGALRLLTILSKARKTRRVEGLLFDNFIVPRR
jgi:hypothetical protein